MFFKHVKNSPMSDFCPSDPLLEVSKSDVQPSDMSESVRRPNYGVRVRPMSDKMGSDPSLARAKFKNVRTAWAVQAATSLRLSMASEAVRRNVIGLK